MYYYLKNAQGDIYAIVDSTGAKVAQYTYDAWGNILTVTDGNGVAVASSNKTHIANLNPFRYRGYFYDVETGLYYLQSRYYDASLGRFINEDRYIQSSNGLLGTNMFVYCENNPVNNIDPYGTVSQKAADKIITENAKQIYYAAMLYGVDPVTIAGCIYAEQRLNVNIWDTGGDWLALLGMDTSIGIGQVLMSTAKYIEKSGYFDRVISGISTYVYRPNYMYYNHPQMPKPPAGDLGQEIPSRYYRLKDNNKNILYVAAYLRILIDLWVKKFPQIASRPDILATLYNNGHTYKQPHSYPKPGTFGQYVKDNYKYIQSLLIKVNTK